MQVFLQPGKRAASPASSGGAKKVRKCVSTSLVKGLAVLRRWWRTYLGRIFCCAVPWIQVRSSYHSQGCGAGGSHGAVSGAGAGGASLSPASEQEGVSICQPVILVLCAPGRRKAPGIKTHSRQGSGASPVWEKSPQTFVARYLDQTLGFSPVPVTVKVRVTVTV